MPPARDAGAVRSRWIRACIAGELVGFIPPAVTGALLVTLDAPEILLVLGLVVAGLGEGLVLGVAQSMVLRDALPNVTGWVVATTLAAGVAWLAGMGGSALVQAAGPLALLVAGPGWILGLLSMGYLQWRRLRHSVVGAVQWIPVTTVAWLIGVAIPVVALSAVPNGWPLGAHVVVGVAAAVAMGATVGALTGSTLARFARQASAFRAPPDSPLPATSRVTVSDASAPAPASGPPQRSRR